MGARTPQSPGGARVGGPLITTNWSASPPSNVSWVNHCRMLIEVCGRHLDAIGKPCRFVMSTQILGMLAMAVPIHFVTPTGRMPKLVAYILGMELWIDFAMQPQEIHIVEDLGDQPLGLIIVQ